MIADAGWDDGHNIVERIVDLARQPAIDTVELERRAECHPRRVAGSVVYDVPNLDRLSVVRRPDSHPVVRQRDDS